MKNLNVGYWGEGKTRVPRENLTVQGREPTNSTHTWQRLGVEPGTHWWEASALTSASSLHPTCRRWHLKETVFCSTVTCSEMGKQNVLYKLKRSIVKIRALSFCQNWLARQFGGTLGECMIIPLILLEEYVIYHPRSVQFCINLIKGIVEFSFQMPGLACQFCLNKWKAS